MLRSPSIVNLKLMSLLIGSLDAFQDVNVLPMICPNPTFIRNIVNIIHAQGHLKA